MGVAQATVWEVRTTGVSTNGGGFVTGASGVDYSQQDSAQFTLSGLTSSGAGSTVLTTSASSDMVGNIIHVTSGTNFTVGFFEITSISAGVSITCSTNQAGTSITTGVGATGAGNIGGAYKFGTSTDPVFSAGVAPGNTTWIASGTYTLNTAFTFTDSTATKQSYITGYNASRNDNPTGTSRPVINTAGTSCDYGSDSVVSNIIFTGTATLPATSDGRNIWYNNKFINTSTSTGRFGIAPGNDDLIINCEVISQAGFGISINGDLTVVGCYVHDCATGIRSAAPGSIAIILNNIVAGCFTNAVQFSAAETAIGLVAGNTLYGNNNTGIGINIAANATGVRAINNIITGFATGISAATANIAGWSNWNDLNNNTTNRTNWTAGVNDITAAPAFANVAIVSGTAGTVSSATLTDNSADFSNVTDSQDYLDIISGTGVTTTPGSLLITSHTTHSVTVAATIGGSGTNIVYNVRTGNNFAVSPTMKNLGFPGLFPGSLTTGHLDIGAVQRHEYGRPIKH